jgi:hypothetical protein
MGCVHAGGWSATVRSTTIASRLIDVHPSGTVSRFSEASSEVGRHVSCRDPGPAQQQRPIANRTERNAGVTPPTTMSILSDLRPL